VTVADLVVPGVALIVAAIVSHGAIRLLIPWLERTSPAVPNERSSHSKITPQGAGIGVMMGAAAGAAILLVATETRDVSFWSSFLFLVLATAALTILGRIDDRKALSFAPKLFVQFVCCAAVAWTTPDGLRVLPDAVPLSVERVLATVGLVWFVNVVNFMDGMDGMTAAEIIPLSAFMAAASTASLLPSELLPIALPLCGAMLGFAPLNLHPARVFLGDAGSLPIGLLTGWMVYLAACINPIAAFLPPLYYLADTGITLARRMLARKRFWEAHREHFYQRALICGFSQKYLFLFIAKFNLLINTLAFYIIK
jgi:UDP-N-acetylmuramyl pentapeptide phosphotransferase/UDP-N-acetylglucosamine-1-phosphate transferase